MGVGVLSDFKKIGGKSPPQRKTGYYERVAYDFCLSLCFSTQETRVTSFNLYPNFWEWVLIKTQIAEI